MGSGVEMQLGFLGCVGTLLLYFTLLFSINLAPRCPWVYGSLDSISWKSDICLLFHIKISSGILLKQNGVLKLLAVRANKGKGKVTIMCQALYEVILSVSSHLIIMVSMGILNNNTSNLSKAKYIKCSRNADPDSLPYNDSVMIILFYSLLWWRS